MEINLLINRVTYSLSRKMVMVLVASFISSGLILLSNTAVIGGSLCSLKQADRNNEKLIGMTLHENYPNLIF